MFGKKDRPEYRYEIWCDLLPGLVWPVGWALALLVLIQIVERDPARLVGAPLFVLFFVALGYAYCRFNGPSVAIRDGEIKFTVTSAIYPYEITVPGTAPLELDWTRSKYPVGRLGGRLWFRAEPHGWKSCGPFRDPEMVFNAILRCREFGLDDPELVALAEKHGWSKRVK